VVRLLLALALLGVLLMWALGPPSPGVSNPAAVVVSAGQLAGMTGGLLVCVQILLVAKTPWLERAVGMDRLVGWHRTLGTVVLLLIVLHVLLNVFGTRALARVSLRTQILGTTLLRPGVLLALIGTAVLLAAGLTSARLVRRHLSYESWYWLHTVTYLGTYLTFGHQIWAGAHFVGNQVNRALWLLLYLGTAGVVVVWRFVLPAAATVRHRVRVEKVVEETAGTTSVWLRGRHLEELNVRGGQFFFFRFLARGHFATAHPYSISALPERDRMRITVGALGDHSSAVNDLRPGTLVLMKGPFGRFTSDRAQARKVLLIAGGAGIGPIRALAHEMSDEGRDVVVVHRGRSAEDLPLREELADHDGLRFLPLLGRRAELGHDPLSAVSLSRLVPDVRRREVFICGSPGLTRAANAALTSAGVHPRHIHHEALSMS
jgi:predicted ferric reductase